MTSEKELIIKSYYKTIVGEQVEQPIKVLGEMFLNEQQKEVPDLSTLRFAQGELYYDNKDFETAIFKWENITDDLMPWAQKNIADAYSELNWLALAEEAYLAVKSDSDVLKTEVLLQLFSLYIKLGQFDKAVDSIKKAVDLNPDYEGVTHSARLFFEKHQDWNNAIELAVREAIRTESLTWVNVLESYIEMGHTSNINPEYFNETLTVLYNLDQNRFVGLTSALWKSYKQSKLYFSWLNGMNELLSTLDLGCTDFWSELSDLYKETYFELINGDLLINDFSYLIPNHLTNWMKVAVASDTLISSSAVLAWKDLITSHLDPFIVTKAEKVIRQSVREIKGVEDAVRLFDSILKWTEEKGLLVSERLKWLVYELLEKNQHRLLIAGAPSSGKSTLINRLLNDELLEDYTSATVLFKDSQETALQVVTDDETRSISDFSDFRQSTKSPQAHISFKSPFSFLKKNNLVLIDTPGLVDQRKIRNQVFQYLHFADSLLYVLNADSQSIGKELEMAVRMKEEAPTLPVHFLLWKTVPANSEDVSELIEKATSRIETQFPKAKVVGLYVDEERESQFNKLTTFFQSITEEEQLKENQTTKLLYYINKSIQFLLEKRMEMETDIIDKIHWEDEIATKLQGASHQMSDMEEQKARVIKQSYSENKNEWRQDLLVKLPDLLRGCSDFIHEDSDFGKLHIALNEEMNRRMSEYMELTVLPTVQKDIEGWILNSEHELRECQTHLDELSGSFNQLFGEEKITLHCDFKIVEDWLRDMSRMTRVSFPLEKANILLRSTPSQVLLKSAGKLFGVITKNNDLLYNKYKQFIESQDYQPIAQTIVDEFLKPFDLFEKSLERDINMFFTSPYDVLNHCLEELQKDIHENKRSLSDMQKSPEMYRDPLTLFELKIRQLEWMDAVGERVHEYY